MLELNIPSFYFGAKKMLRDQMSVYYYITRQHSVCHLQSAARNLFSFRSKKFDVPSNSSKYNIKFVYYGINCCPYLNVNIS